MLSSLAITALAADINHVLEGKTAEVYGPAVWMSEETYVRYDDAQIALNTCRVGTQRLQVLVNESTEKVLTARDLAKQEFAVNTELINTQVQTIADLGARLDQSERRGSRAREQRNLAWGVLAGEAVITIIAGAIIIRDGVP